VNAAEEGFEKCLVTLFCKKIKGIMDWQTILMIVIAALLLFVWLPILVVSVRRTIQKSRNDNKII
jgi:hypothetical protein